MIRKTIVSVLILCMLTCLLAGCGSNKDKEEKKEEVAKVVKGSAEDMLKEMAEMKRGTMSFSLTVKQKGTDQFNASGDYTFDNDDKEYSLGFTVGVSGTKMELGEIIRITGNKFYFNLGAIKDAAVKAATKAGASTDDIPEMSGWFMLPLPEDMPEFKASGDTTNKVLALMKGLFKDSQFEGVDGDYSATFKNKEDYIRVFRALQEYLNTDAKDLMKDVPDTKEVISKIDWNKYVSTLIDTYQDDLYGIVEEYGEDINVTKKQVDDLLDEASKQDYNKLVETYLQKVSTGTNLSQDNLESSVGELARSIDSLIKDLEAAPADEMPDATLRISADDKGYVISIGASAGKAEEFTEASLEIRMNPESVTVKNPKDITGIKGIAEMLIPSYMRYVEKSRNSADISMLADIMAGAEKVAVDPQYDLPAGTEFTVAISDGAATLSVTGSGSNNQDAAKEWMEISCYYDNSFRSKVMRKAEGKLSGILQWDGEVLWSLMGANDSLKEGIRFSPDFMRRYNISE